MAALARAAFFCVTSYQPTPSWAAPLKSAVKGTPSSWAARTKALLSGLCWTCSVTFTAPAQTVAGFGASGAWWVNDLTLGYAPIPNLKLQLVVDNVFATPLLQQPLTMDELLNGLNPQGVIGDFGHPPDRTAPDADDRGSAGARSCGRDAGVDSCGAGRSERKRGQRRAEAG